MGEANLSHTFRHMAATFDDLLLQWMGTATTVPPADRATLLKSTGANLAKRSLVFPTGQQQHHHLLAIGCLLGDMSSSTDARIAERAIVVSTSRDAEELAAYVAADTRLDLRVADDVESSLDKHSIVAELAAQNDSFGDAFRRLSLQSWTTADDQVLVHHTFGDSTLTPIVTVVDEVSFSAPPGCESITVVLRSLIIHQLGVFGGMHNLHFGSTGLVKQLHS